MTMNNRLVTIGPVSFFPERVSSIEWHDDQAIVYLDHYRPDGFQERIVFEEEKDINELRVWSLTFGPKIGNNRKLEES